MFKVHVTADGSKTFQVYERARLPKKLGLHDLRRTFAGLFLASGSDIFKLSKILGHSSVAITQQVCAHSRVSYAMPEKRTLAPTQLAIVVSRCPSSTPCVSTMISRLDR